MVTSTKTKLRRALTAINKSDVDLIKQLCLANKVIAQTNHTSEQMVKNHVSLLSAKIGVDNRTAIVVKALVLGLVSLNDLEYKERHV